ncbi:MAG TPA: hypothetical protein PLN85_03860 [archaeon]|jgi:hypothetical protein|nr:hypothetical protein [archaeon]HRT02705.1 hypothetical protein [Candidatus Diapherotrites archaeon]
MAENNLDGKKRVSWWIIIVIIIVFIIAFIYLISTPRTIGKSDTILQQDSFVSSQNDLNIDYLYDPSCSDGVQNNDELGIDCGGSCPVQDCCDNGWWDENNGEDGVDCGGSCSLKDCCKNGYWDVYLGEYANDCGPVCNKDCCKNGFWDAHLGEDGADCGGSCQKCPEPSCNDGLINQGEDEIDCGGPCPPCKYI